MSYDEDFHAKDAESTRFSSGMPDFVFVISSIEVFLLIFEQSGKLPSILSFRA
jgi:hypothetical protein